MKTKKSKITIKLAITIKYQSKTLNIQAKLKSNDPKINGNIY